jgi:hypothetical protein
MSVTIPAHFVKQFGTNVHLLAEQRFSRLRDTVTVRDVTGESFTEERIGTTKDTANVVTNRHGDTPLNNTPHTRRWGFVADYDVADLIDKQDRVKMLVDIDSAYTLRHAGVMGRSIDTTIIAALEGSVIEGQTGGTTTTFPAAQQIASGSVGLTIGKLIEAKKKLDAAEVEDFMERFFICSAEQIADLLEDDKVTSKDFNTVQALVRGDIDTFLGFKFRRTERLTSSGGARLCYAYARPGVVFGAQVSPTTIASDRPDKRHAKQIYTYGSWGALRREDAMVVQVACTE